MPEDNQTTGGLPPVEQTSSGALSPQYYATVNKKLQDPDSTAKLRERLEKFLEERESPMNLILGGLKDATAWTGGGIEGPTATLATRDRQKASEFDNLFKMQQEMAQIKAAEDQQRDYADRMRQLGTGVFGGAQGAGAGAGGAGAGGDMVPYMGIMIPRERALAMIKAPNQAAHDKIFNEYIHELDKSRLGMEYNPSTYDQKEIAVGNQIKSANAMELKRIDSIAKKENIPFKEAAKKYFEGQSGVTPAGQPAQTPSAPVSGQQPTSAPVKSPEILKAIQTGTLGRESSFGKADTSKPGIQGAVGPGQITPDTFQTAKNLKIIPQDYDINKPEQNIVASNKLIEHYYNKYDGDVDKTLAAYHGGEGAINKDGSINLDRKDKLGTSIRDYISSTKKIAGLSGATAETAVNRLGQTAQATTPVQEKSLSELKSDLEVKADVAKKERGKLAEGYVADVQDVQANKSLAGQTLASANAVNRLVDKHKDVFGTLQHPTVAAAFAGLIQSGAHAAGIQASMPGLTAAIRKVMPGVTDDDIVAVQQVGAELARFKLLDARTYLKGQGAVSDMERNLIAELSGSIDSSPKAIQSFMEWRILRAQFDKELGEELRKWNNANPDAPSKEFINSDKVANMRNAYDKKLQQFSNTFGLGQSGSSGKKEETKPHPGKSLVDKYAPR